MSAHAQETGEDDAALTIGGTDEIAGLIDAGPGGIGEDATGELVEEEDEDEDETLPPLRTGPVGPVGQVEPGTVIEEEDPYAAQGIRFGSLTFRPSVEIGYNATRTVSRFDTGTGVGKAATDRTSLDNSLRLLVNSDWSRHELELDLKGTIPVKISGEEEDPVYDANARLRLDLSSATTLSLGTQLNVSRDDPQSSAFDEATDQTLFPGVRGVNDPTTTLYGGYAALTHDFGGVTAALTTAIQRLEYSAAKLNNGTSVSQSDLNATNYDVTLRGGYALSGILSPFVEFNFGQRIMDEDFDNAGIDRNADRYGLRLGTEIDMGEKISGEVAVGYGLERLADERLEDVGGVTLDAQFGWSPLRGTDVTWSARTGFQPSGDEDVSGSILYATELGLQHRLLSNLTANATLGAQYERFEGPQAAETTLSGEVGLVYNLNRFVALTGRARHEETLSSDAVSRESSTGGFVGLRLQR